MQDAMDSKLEVMQDAMLKAMDSKLENAINTLLDNNKA